MGMKILPVMLAVLLCLSCTDAENFDPGTSQAEENLRRAGPPTDQPGSVWFAPNAERNLVPSRIDETFGAAGREALAATMHTWAVFKFYLYGLSDVSDADLKAFGDMLRLYRKKVAVETAGLAPSLCRGQASAERHIRILRRFYDLGFRINYIALDGLVWRVLAGSSASSCNFTVEQAITELGAYAAHIHDTLDPEIQFDFIINVPNETVGGTPCFHRLTVGCGQGFSHGGLEILDILQRAVAEFRSRGIPVSSVHADNPWGYLDNHPGVPNVIDSRLRVLARYAESMGLRYGQIFNGEASLSTAEASSRNAQAIQSERFYGQTNQFLKRFGDLGFRVDDVVIQSWYSHPHHFGPVLSPFSATWDIVNLRPQVMRVRSP